IGGDLIELIFDRDVLLQQKPFKPINRIVVLFPPLDFAFRNVTLTVMLGVSFAAISLRLDQNCAVTGSRMFNRAPGDLEASNHVVAVDDVRGDAEGAGFLSE